MSWQVTKNNAIEKLEGAKLLLEHRLFTDAYEAGFFAIEIALKAWMIKVQPALSSLRPGRDGNHQWFSHDLLRLLDSNPLLRKSLQHGCQREYLLLRQMSGDSAGWKPWKRYHNQASKDLALGYVNLAEGLQKWMLSNLLSP